MRMVGVVLLVAALCGCAAGGRVVARAGEHELTAERLGEIFAAWRPAQTSEGVAQRVANWWVEYHLFAQRIVAGDSLLDSATVLDVMWPKARGYVLARFREQLLAGILPLDSASLDSAYHSGDHRLIQHILIRADSAAPPDARTRQRQHAEDLRAQLEQGALWETVNRENQDRVARDRGGSIGVIRRGETASGVSQAAFALRPGEISPVVESGFGFHIIRRPTLREVREQFRTELERILPQEVDSLYRRDVLERRRLRFTRNGLQRARETLRDPLSFKASDAVLATFDEGRFTAADLVRWLQTVPDFVHTQVERGTEQQLVWFLETMMGYELMYLDASRNGVTLSADAFEDLKHDLAGRLDELKAVLSVYPRAAGDSAGTEELEQRAARNIDHYVATLDHNWERFKRVPVPLAEKLKHTSRWAVYPRGIARALERESELRAAADSAGR